MTDPIEIASTPRLVDYRHGSEEFDPSANPFGLIRLLSLCAAAAVVSALPAAICIAMKFGALLLITGLGQGVMLGWFLRRVFRNFRLRNPRHATIIALLSALLAVVSLHVDFYLWDVFRLSYQVAGRFGKPSIASVMRGRPFALHNLAVRMLVGRGGVAGYAIMRLRNSAYSTATLIHLIVTPMLVLRGVRRGAASAFCASCGKWMDKPVNASIVPVDLRDPLVEAIESGEPARALALNHVAAGLPLGTSCVIARLYRCKSCGEAMADVIQKQFGRRSGQFVALKPMAVSRDFAAALRSDPVVATQDPPEPSNAQEQEEEHEQADQ